MDLSTVNEEKTYLFITHDGAEIIGKLVSYDDKEVLIYSIKAGELSIPSYQLKAVEEVDESNISAEGKVLRENIFATRYFITTNGLPIRKNESYAMLSTYGPDLQYGVSDHVSLGVMTSWLGVPIIGSIKYSQQIDDNNSFAIGVLGGSLGWADWNSGGILPYGAYTIGNRINNFTISAGYAGIWFDTWDGKRESVGDALFSIAGMNRISNSVSVVYDSFILAGIGEDSNFTAILMPGFRFQRKEGFALQFGLAGIYADQGFLNIPFPMLQLFLKF